MLLVVELVVVSAVKCLRVGSMVVPCCDVPLGDVLLCNLLSSLVQGDTVHSVVCLLLGLPPKSIAFPLLLIVVV